MTTLKNHNSLITNELKAVTPPYLVSVLTQVLLQK